MLSFIKGKFNLEMIKSVMLETTNLSAMVFLIVIGARAFGLIFRALNGSEIMLDLATSLVESHSRWFFLFIVMAFIFILGFFMEFIEISFIFLPVLAPILIEFKFDPLWIALLIGINLQCSFITPPFGFSIFFLKGVAPPEVKTTQLYKGVVPYIFLQAIAIVAFVYFPQLVDLAAGNRVRTVNGEGDFLLFE